MLTPQPDDPVLRAHFRRQRDWASDAPALMARQTTSEQKRHALLAALDRRDNERRKKPAPAKPAARKRCAAAKTATKPKSKTRKD